MRIFLSYRRSDVGGHAGRLSDSLAQRLGSRNVFQDVTDIGAGHDFAAAIHGALEGADAAVAVIGPGWLEASTADGRPRLFDPDDYVRLELATVLKRNVPVAPALVGGASLPAAADLPEDLRPLVGRQAIELRDASWHQDVDNLLRSLRGEPVVKTKRPLRRSTALAAAVLLAAAIGVAAWRPWDGGAAGDDDGSEARPSPSCPDPTGAGWTTFTPHADPRVSVDSEGGQVEFTVRAARWRPLRPGQWQVVLDTTMGVRNREGAYHDYYRYGSLILAEREFDQTCFESERDQVDTDTVGDARVGYTVSCEPKGRIQLVTEAGRIPVTDDPDPSSC